MPGSNRDELEAAARRAQLIAYRVALGVTRDAHMAEDVAQDVAIAAIRYLSRLRDPDALDRWIYRTASRASIRAATKRTRQRTADTLYANDRSLHPDTEPDANLQALFERLAPLPPRQRAAMTLRYGLDLKPEQIAAALGCRTNTAKSLLARGALALRRAADPIPPEDSPR